MHPEVPGDAAEHVRVFARERVFCDQEGDHVSDRGARRLPYVYKDGCVSH